MDALGLKSGNWLILPRQGLWREQGPAHGSVQPECKLQRSQCRSRWAGTIHSPAPCFCSKMLIFGPVPEESPGTPAEPSCGSKVSVSVCWRSAPNSPEIRAGLLPSPWQWPGVTMSSALLSSGIFAAGNTANFRPGCQIHNREGRCGFTTVISASVELQQLWI